MPRAIQLILLAFAAALLAGCVDMNWPKTGAGNYQVAKDLAKETSESK